MDADRTEVVSFDVFLNAVHGDHAHAGLVGREGTAAMTAPGLTRANRTGQGSFALPGAWVPRFAQACRDPMQGWVRSVVADRPVGASAWDG